MNPSAPASQRAIEMRRAFDAAFAAPPAAMSLAEEQMLAVRVAGTGYAIRLAELAGLVAAKRIVPVPGRARAALGVVERGGLVPVYSLAAVLSDEPAHEPPNWLLLCPGEQPLALAFAELEGHLRVAASNLYAIERAHAFGTQLVRVGTESRAVVSIPAVVETITRLVSPDGRPEE